MHAQLLPTLRDPMDCSQPGSSVYGIFQVKILEWAVISYFRDLANSGIKPIPPALAGGLFTIAPPGKPGIWLYNLPIFL